MRASYRHGVEWIALNDEPEEMDVDEVACLVSTCLLADLFGKEERVVAADVIRKRSRARNARLREKEAHGG